MLIKYLIAILATVSVNLSAGTIIDKRPLQQVRTDFARARALFPPDDTISICIIGDVMMHTRQLSYDYTQFLEGPRARLESADFSIANMEYTLAGEPYTGYPAFSAPDGYTRYLSDIGVDLVLLANNHILDKGPRGLRRTLAVLDSIPSLYYTGIHTNGVAQPLLLPVRGLRFAFLNMSYGTNLPHSGDVPKINNLSEDLDSLFAKSAGADVIVALPHWGEEYILFHSKTQEAQARKMVKLGASAVVGAHPHVVQDSMMIEGVPVFFSIGNAVSNMSAKNTRLELMITLRIVRDLRGDFRMIEPLVDYMWCTLPGTLTDGYQVIMVEDYIGKRDSWKNPGDYDNMIETYKRISGKE